jgi:predicted nicotinamide N-methyase
LELGSGTGLVGISAAVNGAKEVVLTDLLELADLLASNVERNAPAASQCTTTVEEYDWCV